MNCFPAFIMSASFGIGRFREINTSKTFLRRYRAEETAEAMTSRGRPRSGRLKARLAHQRFIFLTASVSASIIAHYLIQRNKIFILLRSRTPQIYRRTRCGEQSAQYPRRTLAATKYTFCWRWPVKPVCGRCPDRYQTATPFCCIIPRNAGAVKPCRAFSGIFAPKARRP